MSANSKVTTKAAVQLRAVFAAIDAGEIHAEPDQVTYLRGAADALATSSTDAKAA